MAVHDAACMWRRFQKLAVPLDLNFEWNIYTPHSPGISGILDLRDVNFYNRGTFVNFATKNGAQQPDLVAAYPAGDGTCASADSYFVFSVTGILDTPDPTKQPG
ncbi:hypothetical protein F4820DRAFT_446734 [Hypoxylon rubiginosum]|uniref:Uncharacterized protein n=1 Tax=Hypoxylon rubiginosum TaxID=110542 RepID=A0ACB9Z6Q3_9PEZI|nr:hypothetical protein F4820DRAFT_446734 [Hypoxylon rubiginosum]